MYFFVIVKLENKNFARIKKNSLSDFDIAILFSKLDWIYCHSVLWSWYIHGSFSKNGSLLCHYNFGVGSSFWLFSKHFSDQISESKTTFTNLIGTLLPNYDFTGYFRPFTMVSTNFKISFWAANHMFPRSPNFHK